MSRTKITHCLDGSFRWEAHAKGTVLRGKRAKLSEAEDAVIAALVELNARPSRSGAHRAERFGLKFPARHRPEWEWAAKEAGVPVATWVAGLANAEYEGLRKVRGEE